MKTIRFLIIAVLMVMAFAIAGCDGSAPNGQQGVTTPANNKSGEQSQPAGTATNPEKTMQLVVYHATKDAMYLVPEAHKVPVDSHPARTAMELLLAGTKNPELVKVMPEGTQLKNLTIKDHIAYADFNEKLNKRNGGGGSASEILLVAAIVNTLTEFPDIHQVQIMVNGKKIETISGHMDTSEPLSRSEKIIKK